MHIKKVAIALAMTAGLSSNAALAAETYVGISVGKSDVKSWVTEEDINQIFIEETGFPVTSGHGETSDSSLKIYLGIASSENLHIRLGYANLGEATFEAANSFVSLDGSVENQGVFADLLARFKPAEKIAVYGKIGAAFMKTDMTISAVGPGGSFEETLQGDSLVLVPGVGISLNITEKIGLSAEYERYLDVGDDEETGTSDVDVVTAGIFVSF
ncbi:MAG: outer membrane beta-barrel protein [Moraxellaceae bacterium]